MIDSAAAEAFLIQEAALLDAWRLEEWLNTFTDDATYTVPPTDIEPEQGLEADPRCVLFLIADSMSLIRARVKRLLNDRAHAEHPRSRTRRLVSNVRLLESTGDRALVASNFAIFRARSSQLDIYVGQYRHELVVRGAGFAIRSRRAVLDLESLSPMGSISFIL